MDKNKPRLSILIPTYNREAYIATAIDSVLNQPFQDFEIICSDNASTDRTFEILKEYSTKDDRIKVYQNEENLGPVLNWKNCLDKSHGEFIHWLWSDDWIESNFYQDGFALMVKNDSQLVTSWVFRSDNPEDYTDKYISWQCSIDQLPGEIAAKKILLSTRELPVSPAAYILPAFSVKKHFYTNISIFGDLDPVAKGVGVDSLMVIGSCMDAKQISVLKIPSVVFRKHDNLSVILSRDGGLRKMYYLSHLWFIEQNKIHLNLRELIILSYLTVTAFRLSLFSFKLLFRLFSSFREISLSKPFFKLSDRYRSDKVTFK